MYFNYLFPLNIPVTFSMILFKIIPAQYEL